MDVPRLHQLIIFTRFPEPGTTKTRLIPCLGPEGAARLQREMTEHLLKRVASVRTPRQWNTEIRFEGGTESRVREWLGPDLRYAPQGAGDLGTRMNRAVREARQDGAADVVIIGSDIPGISGDIIEKAFFALSVKPLVLGPAADGGYYLIGLRRDAAPDAVSALFDGISWGSDTVLADTTHRAEREKLAWFRLPRLRDVDRPEDLPVWEAASGGTAQSRGPSEISIIIPALDEAGAIEKTIGSTAAEGRREIIVVDGGSTDGTPDLARALGARVVRSTPPRAQQLNLGALEATGDILLFLHADTRLPTGYDSAVLRAVESPSFVAGAFGLGIDSPRPGFRLLERLVDIRSRFFKLPYGDQALFFTQSSFYRAGGYPHLPIMDDYELMRTIRRQGRIVMVKPRVSTSPRRWRKLGLWRTTLINQRIIIGYRSGVSPHRLAEWYRRERGT